MGVVTSAALVLLLLLGGAVAPVGEEVMEVVVSVVEGTVVGVVEVTVVGVEVLIVVGAMVVGGGGARGGGVGLSADTTEDSVNSTTREELEKRKIVKDVKQDSTSSTETTVTP